MISRAAKVLLLSTNLVSAGAQRLRKYSPVAHLVERHSSLQMYVTMDVNAITSALKLKVVAGVVAVAVAINIPQVADYS